VYTLSLALSYLSLSLSLSYLSLSLSSLALSYLPPPSSLSQELGIEATDQYLTYVECDKKGANSKRDFCKEKKVPGFPTWEINGELFPGEKSLDDLAKISGFKGAVKK
jgi:hypothetical protein